MQRILYQAVLLFARTVYNVLWWPVYKGRDRLPDGAFLICPNHRSWFDPPLCALLMWRQISFFAKAELFANPLIGWFLRSLNANPVRRGTIDRKALDRLKLFLGRGIPVMMFPEGTRSRTGKMLAPRPGVGMVARQSGVPVVPIYIAGSSGIERKPLRWGRLRMACGDPITVREINAFPDNKEGYRQLSWLILRRICDLADNPQQSWDEARAAAGKSETAPDTRPDSTATPQ